MAIPQLQLVLLLLLLLLLLRPLLPLLLVWRLRIRRRSHYPGWRRRLSTYDQHFTAMLNDVNRDLVFVVHGRREIFERPAMGTWCIGLWATT
jgi:hypothetical protein